MNGFSNGVMIALLPTTTDWCKQEFPHMTLVYAGKKDGLKPTTFNELAKDAASIAMLSNPITLRVTGVEVFGAGDLDNPKVDVLRLEPTQELLAMRRVVESWNASEFPFKPHVTIGPQGAYLEYPPRVLTFDRVAVGWGDESLVFLMKR